MNKETPDSHIAHLIADLENSSTSRCLKARQSLVEIGEAAVPGLDKVLANGNRQTRWEAAKALAEIRSPASAPALVQALQDEDAGVRWAAMDALIGLDQAGLKPLLEALIRDFQSVWLREGAHHILHTLRRKGHLPKPFVNVYEALEGAEPEVEVPWTAEKAWEKMLQSR
jgi:HEAT repeat protein